MGKELVRSFVMGTESLCRAGKTAAAVLLIASFAVVFSGCGKSPTAPVGGPVQVYVKDTETGSSLNGIPVSLRCSSEKQETTTQGGIARFEIDSPKTCSIMVNFSNSQAGKNNEYIPSMVEDIGLAGGENIEIDIVKKSFLNPYNYNWRYLLNAYRGKENAGIGYPNQRWNSKPEKWVVYDPHGNLKKYPDPKNNPIFDNIMKGFQAIQQYTRGFIKAPSREEVEIRTRGGDTTKAIYFEITDREAYEVEDVNYNDEIVKSGAGAGPTAPYDTICELTSCVQGGDNDSYYGVFNKGYISDLDRRWGRFNYWKRKPGDKMVLDGPYGHLYEIRKIE